MNRTSIEWVRNPDGTQGFTWNPIVGCSRGCPYCYARRFAKRNGHRCAKCATFEPHLHEERLEEPMKRKKPSGIFVCSMGELFDDRVQLGWVRAIVRAMAHAYHHRYYVLTKQNAMELIGADYVWLGATVDNPELSGWPEIQIGPRFVPRTVKRFISFEPLLHAPTEYFQLPDWLDWIIIGAQTGPGAVKPKRQWVTDIIKQADAVGIPVFIKNNLLRIYPDLPRRQEVPE